MLMMVFTVTFALLYQVASFLVICSYVDRVDIGYEFPRLRFVSLGMTFWDRVAIWHYFGEPPTGDEVKSQLFFWQKTFSASATVTTTCIMSSLPLSNTTKDSPSARRV